MLGSLGLAALSLAAAGCASPARIHVAAPVAAPADASAAGFDVDGDQRADFWQYSGPDGRVSAMAFPAAADANAAGPRVELDALDAAACPHFIIALDGVPYEVVRELREGGAFRLFHPPARLISCFPSMTDLAFAQIFHAPRCHAYQALYFDRATNRPGGGNDDYLAGKNAPWVRQLRFRAASQWDTLAYIDPQRVFKHELAGMAEVFDKAAAGDEAAAYSVGTAGLGTRGGREAIVKYLREVDALCERIVYDRRGKVKLTLLADHGHNLTPNKRVSFERTLRAAGFRPRNALNDARDVVIIEFGLVTYADFYTKDPAGVGACLAQHEDVELTCWREGDAVVVRDRAGAARVTRSPGGYRYDASGGDPLKLAPVIEALRRAGHVLPDGQIDQAAFFAVTVEHEYPDALRRVWEAFNGLVEDPPDVIANLRDGVCHGRGLFELAIGRAASTHGSLNRINSTAFVMTMLGELPPALRLDEVQPTLARLRGAGAAATH